MGSKLKAFRRRATAQTKPRNVGDDTLMLAAGKQFLEEQENIIETADDSILFVVDVRDEIGAMWAAGVNGMLDVESFVGSIVETESGEKNPHPFVAFWWPRNDETLALLGRTGFQVPGDWATILQVPPPAGAVYTLLKRSDLGVLLTVDYASVPSLGALAAR